MNDFINKIKSQFLQTDAETTKFKPTLIGWLLIGLVLIFVLFGRQVKRLFKLGGRKHSPAWYTKAARDRRKLRKSGRPGRRRRALPLSVGLRKHYTKSGKTKKPWQVKGSEAARRHMRRIRAMR